MRFRQKIWARRQPEREFEEAAAIREWNGMVYAVWPDCEGKWIARSEVQTSAERWYAANRDKMAQWQREHRARKAAEKTGRPLQEIVYEMEARAAKRRAKKDPAEKLREYNRDRQRAHRAKAKEAKDEAAAE